MKSSQASRLGEESHSDTTDKGSSADLDTGSSIGELRRSRVGSTGAGATSLGRDDGGRVLEGAAEDERGRMRRRNHRGDVHRRTRDRNDRVQDLGGGGLF
jgi:hypothetical protein